MDVNDIKALLEGADDDWLFRQGDPVLWLLTNKLGIHPVGIILVVTIVTSAITFGGGWIVSHVVYPDMPMIRVEDPEHLWYALLVHCAYLPIIWLIWLWQPQAIVNTLKSLRDQNVILDEEKAQFEALCEKMRGCMNRGYLPFAAVLVVLIIVVLQTSVVFPAQTAAMGKPYFWFVDKRFYYWLNIASWFLTYYVTAMVAIKGVLTLGWFYYLFRKLSVRVHPLHPDQAGGLGAIGNLAARYGAIGIAIGMMAASYGISRALAGAGWIHPDIIILYGLYLILTPVSLLLPMWSAHEGMLKARSQPLAQISGEFGTMLREVLQARGDQSQEMWFIESLCFEVTLRRKGEPGTGDRSDLDKGLQKLQARYNLIMGTFPVWPIRFGFARNLTIVALLPLVTGVVSLISSILG